ncbi:MAG TPA: Spy/CpxP family protein refolding chaperone [Pseudomonadales bacterium]|jgi:Spy/CpxP family protein refolding chaperone
MKSLVKTISLMSVLLCTVLMGSAVWAGPGGGPDDGPDGARMNKALEQLDLSDAQRKQVDALMEATRKDMRSLMERRHKAMQAMEPAKKAAWDAKKARQQADAYGAIAADMAYQRMEMGSRLRAILNDQQWQALEKMRNERRGDMREQIGSRGDGKGPRHDRHANE